jgi:SP family sugar:H+ symporter-like MFS transporter
MPFLKRRTEQAENAGASGAAAASGDHVTQEKGTQDGSSAPEEKVTFIACFLGLVASIGGFMFGYVRYTSLLRLSGMLID